ncbi:MAG: helix-turn-helix transcriptional regulator [Clostridiales bacterium]|nr:helix-turn-helix transcriptional regulator [Clostridiales bacterium]
MDFSEKLQLLRKENKLSQEELAQKLNITRQAVAKWESGANLPDVDNLLILSDLFCISLDRLVKSDNGNCVKSILQNKKTNEVQSKEFLFEGKKNTYAAGAPQDKVSSRPYSHDLTYKRGNFLYIDTYLGSEIFLGEEALWIDKNPVWAMNYQGRVLHEMFDGKIFKNALVLGCEKQLYRGPLVYQHKKFSYHCKYDGDFNWFQGYEEMFYESEKIYEGYFHGGIVKD